jgi:hypothetical protein
MNIKLYFIICLSVICLLQPVIGDINLKNISQNNTLILNETPIPDFFWTPEWPNISTIIHFDASNSYDPDGFISEYSWDFTNDGLPDKTGVEVTWSYDHEGIYPVRLSVCDELLLCNGTTKNIRVLNSTPVADFTWNPQDPNINQMVSLDASDSFDPDGFIMTYYWDYDEDQDWDAVGGEEDKIVTYSWNTVGTYIITLKVEDNNLNYEIINKSITIIDNNPPYIPNNPYPIDGALNIPTNIIINWEGGDPDINDAVTYDVYFGSIPPLVKVRSNQSFVEYDPGELSNDLTYFWNIVAWDNHGSKSLGPSWHFTTSSEEDNTPPYVEIINPSSGLYILNQKIMDLEYYYHNRIDRYYCRGIR